MDSNAIYDLETSIIETRKVLLHSLQGSSFSSIDVHSFITHRALARPPFSFIQSLIKIYVTTLSFAAGLYTEEELDPKSNHIRQDKIRFLVKILACVAFITKERVDIYVSPVHVLSGIDITITHLFLRLLARATQVSSEISQIEAQRVLNYGESIIYRNSVLVRNTIVKIQSHIRQKQVKKRFQKPCTVILEAPIVGNGEENKNTAELPSLGNEKTLGPSIPLEIRIDDNEDIDISTSSPCRPSDQITFFSDTMHVDLEGISSPFESLLRSTCSANTEPVNLSNHSKGENSPSELKCSIFENKSDAKIRESPSGRPKIKRLKPSMSLSPNNTVTATTSKESNKVVILAKTKKVSVIHGVIQEKVVWSNPKPLNEKWNREMQIDQPEYTKTAEIERVEKVKRQLIKLHKKEDLICRLTDELKTKESDLLLREKRLLNLSNSLQKQQIKLQRDRCCHKTDFDEIKQRLFENNLKLRNDQDIRYNNTSRPGSTKKEIEDRIALNPSLTDLRLMLEKKSECISRKEKRLIHIERNLRHDNNIVMSQMDSQKNQMRKTTHLHDR